jgi:polyhydroxyalkanoate synthase
VRSTRPAKTGAAKVSDPDEWLEGAVEHPGSWWVHWAQWLKAFGGKQVAARGRLGSRKYEPIEPAPGRYVKEKA